VLGDIIKTVLSTLTDDKMLKFELSITNTYPHEQNLRHSSIFQNMQRFIPKILLHSLTLITACTFNVFILEKLY
jgi:hypothetical protein